MRRAVAVIGTAAMTAAMLAVVATAPAAVAAGQVVYVDGAAGGAGNGSSWTDAFTDLQAALAAVGSGDEIRVAAGVYRPAATDRSASFALVDGVSLRGGYPPGGAPSPDPTTYETVLSGDLAADDAGFFANIADNSFHVVTATGVGAGTVLRGVTIRGGAASGAAPDNRGAGIALDSASPEIREVTLTGNIAGDGAGLYNLSSSPVIVDTVIEGNIALFSGGGIHNASSSPVILRSRIAANGSGGGGGLYNGNGSAPTVVASSILDNSASFFGGGVFSEGGSSATLVSVLVADNSAGEGGGMYNLQSSPSLVNVTIAGNAAGTGPGVYDNVDAFPSVVNSVIWGNGGAGIVDANGSAATVAHSDVEGWVGGVGTIDQDPVFVGGSDYRLAPGSPAIDAGDIASAATDGFDVDGDGDTSEPTPALDLVDRPLGVSVDMGAYEWEGIPDNFADALVLSGPTGTAFTSTVGATGQSGEPSTGCGPAVTPLNSVWFSWTAPTATRMQIDTLGSDFDTQIHVYRGGGLGTLTQVACNDDVPLAGHDQAAVFFDTTAGRTYRIRVDGTAGATGAVRLNWAPAVGVTPSGFVANPEGDTGSVVYQLPINLSAPATVPVTVGWSTADLPTNPQVAVSGLDYVAGSGTVTFMPGETTKSVPIEVLGDTIDEPPLLYGEWGLVTLIDPQYAKVTGGLFGLGLFIIIDDD